MKLLILILISVIPLMAQKINLPNNPLAGRIVFEEKGCIECHAISGYGGDVGPDLIKKQYYGSFLDLTAVIWNHIPKMNRMFRKLHRDRPKFTSEEMLNLISFIYYLHYLGEPGSVSHGKTLIRSKGCLTCHTIDGKGGKVGPDFITLNKNASPLFMVQTMWNHFPKMSKEFSSAGKDIPDLSGKDLVDITSYIKAAGNAKAELRMTPGNPNKGAIVFKAKGCIKCHSATADDEEKIGPSLKLLKLNQSVTAVAALMWNHAESMSGFMKEYSMNWPIFIGTQMADLIAYLYFLDFEDPPGNPGQGETEFSEKNCSSCHGQKDGVGPDLLTGKSKINSPVSMIRKMWNHASGMEDQILTFNEEWPKLTAQQMRDIYAFLSKGN